MRSRAIALLAFAVLPVSSCTLYVRNPPVTLEQRKADNKACWQQVLGGSIAPPVDSASGRGSIPTVINATGLAVTLLDEFERDQAFEACMRQRGYRRAGFTLNPYGHEEPRRPAEPTTSSIAGPAIVAPATSAKSWSSVCNQNSGTQRTPVSADSVRATATADAAL